MSIRCIFERKIRELTRKRLPDSKTHYLLQKAVTLKETNGQPGLEGQYFICIPRVKLDSFNMKANSATKKRAAEAYSLVGS